MLVGFRSIGSVAKGFTVKPSATVRLFNAFSGKCFCSSVNVSDLGEVACATVFSLLLFWQEARPSAKIKRCATGANVFCEQASFFMQQCYKLNGKITEQSNANRGNLKPKELTGNAVEFEKHSLNESGAAVVCARRHRNKVVQLAFVSFSQSVNNDFF